MGNFEDIKKTNQNNSTSHTEVAEIIFCLLNEGSLFSICRILENLEPDDERRYIINAFKKKYDFDLLNYISYTII